VSTASAHGVNFERSTLGAGGNDAELDRFLNTQPGGAPPAGAICLVWVESRLQRILPVHYFHLVFTLPSELHSLAYNNGAAIFALRFRSAADTLLTLAADPKWLGKDAQLGITAVLHMTSKTPWPALPCEQPQ